MNTSLERAIASDTLTHPHPSPATLAELRLMMALQRIRAADPDNPDAGEVYKFAGINRIRREVFEVRPVHGCDESPFTDHAVELRRAVPGLWGYGVAHQTPSATIPDLNHLARSSGLPEPPNDGLLCVAGIYAVDGCVWTTVVISRGSVLQPIELEHDITPSHKWAQAQAAAVDMDPTSRCGQIAASDLPPS